MRSCIATICFLFISLATSAQEFTSDNYYLFPINPGQQSLLAGTMGELRSSHFHAGIDIKTGGRTGLPVRATADGYIWRIKISPYGYGKALYMRHANGTTSVYGHLDHFSDTLETYITAQQYAKEAYGVDIFPPKEAFYYRQGEVIAISGNSGSSSGPHLHFEIRDANQRALDPLKFDFTEIQDDLPPILKKIAFTTLAENARVNGTFGRFEFDITKVDNVYRTKIPIQLEGNIGIEVYAYDIMNDVWSKNGIPELVCRVDGDTIYHHKKNSLSFAKQRNILTHFNYQAYRNGRPKFDKLYLDDGNTLDFYETNKKGFVFQDTTHQIEILLADAYDNISVFNSTVNRRKVVNKPDPKINDYEIHRDFIHFKSNTADSVKLYYASTPTALIPYRVDKKASYYLHDLRRSIPDSMTINGRTIPSPIVATIPSLKEHTFSNEFSSLSFSKYALFDTLYLQLNTSYDSVRKLELFTFNHRDTPLKKNVKVTLKPALDYTDSIAGVYAVYGQKLNYMGGDWDESENTIRFSTRDLVTFTIAEDSIPPEITPQMVSNQKLQFKIDDAMSGIASYRAEIDGEFLLMEYDAKNKRLTAEGRKPNIPFKGVFTLEVLDGESNKTEFKTIL